MWCLFPHRHLTSLKIQASFFMSLGQCPAAVKRPTKLRLYSCVFFPIKSFFAFICIFTTKHIKFSFKTREYLFCIGQEPRRTIPKYEQNIRCEMHRLPRVSFNKLKLRIPSPERQETFFLLPAESFLDTSKQFCSLSLIPSASRTRNGEIWQHIWNLSTAASQLLSEWVTNKVSEWICEMYFFSLSPFPLRAYVPRRSEEYRRTTN